MELKHLALLLALAACAPPSKRLILPEDMRSSSSASARAAASPPQQPTTALATPASTAPPRTLPPLAVATPSSAATPSSTTSAPLPLQPVAKPPPPPPAEQRYVLRLIEHGRVWEVELPEQTAGYEVRVPIGPKIEAPTLADQEMLGREPKNAKPLPPKSYLAGLAKISEMYASHRYELALIEAVDLGQQYPKDARIEAMKGSLYQKLGKTELAREAWKKALELDPSDTTVAEALRGLKGD